MTKLSPEERKLASVARRYKRNGYQVSVQTDRSAAPSFLRGLVPGLIAESDGDRVVVEVKRSDQVRHSNNLLEIAERVSHAEGWRFELVTVPSQEERSSMTPDRLDIVAARVRQALDLGMIDAAYTFAWFGIEVLLWNLAHQSGGNPNNALLHVARDLVSDGAISRESFEAIRATHAGRGWMVEGDRDHDPAVDDVERLLALAGQLRADFANLMAEAV